MEPYKEAFTEIVGAVTCPRCEKITTCLVKFKCGFRFCWACTKKIETEDGRRCFCPICGAESKDSCCRVGLTLWDVACAADRYTAFPEDGRDPPEACNDGVSGGGDTVPEFFSYSFQRMLPLFQRATTRELFERKILDGLKSEAEFSQRISGFSDCSEREQLTGDEASIGQSLSGPGRLCDPELPQQTAPASLSAHIMDLLTRMISDTTKGFKYKTRYKRELLYILDPFTCPHCKEVLVGPVTLNCGHSVCRECARKIGSENKEGQRCCCCPKCGAESVTNSTYFKVNWTLWEAAAVVHLVTECLRQESSAPEVSSAGGSESGCSLGSSCSIGSMDPPPFMASIRELFIRMFLDGLESEAEQLQRLSRFSGFIESKQLTEDEDSIWQELLDSMEPWDDWYDSGAPDSIRADIMYLLRRMMSDGTQGSVYKTKYKQELLRMLEFVTCSHCKDILSGPVRLDCGHKVCWDCTKKIGNENQEGQWCCCCPECGVKSVTEDICSSVDWTRSESIDVIRKHAVFLWHGLHTPKACSAEDSGVGNIRSECSFRSSCSIASMLPPPDMLSKGELFNRLGLPKDGLESEEELSQRPSGSSDYSEREQRPEDEPSARGPLSGSGRLCEPVLPQQTAPASIRAHILHLLKRMISDGTQGSVYKTRYKRELVHILDLFTCPHCKDMLHFPVILDCGHSVCWHCAKKIGSKNKEGQWCCCCPKCGLESVANYMYCMVNQTLWEAADVVRIVTASLGKEWSLPDVSSAEDSDSDLCSGEFCCYLSGMHEPPCMVMTRELLIRLFLPTDDLESEGELSQRRSGSSDCSKREQPSEDEASGGLLESKLPQQSALASTTVRITDMFTHTTSVGREGSMYKTGRYKQALLDIVDRLTCPHCDEIFTIPMTLDCEHSICLSCAKKTESKNKEGQRCCCCPKCGVESITEDLLSRVNLTLLEVAYVADRYTKSLGKGQDPPEACSDGDSGVGDTVSEFSLGSTARMLLPPTMAWKRELFDRMFLLIDGLESEDELSQRPSGSSDCSESKQQSQDESSALQSLSGSGGLCEPKLPGESTVGFTRAQIMDLLTDIISDGTQESPYKTGWYKQALLDILEPLICPHCDNIFTNPVTLDCGHSVCWDCAEKIGSKNKEGQLCCCCCFPKCGVESVTEDLLSWFNETLCEVANVSNVVIESLWKEQSTTEGCSAGDSDSSVRDLMPECSFVLPCTTGSMKPPPHMVSTRELFDRIFVPTDGMESVDELSQPSFESSDCSKSEQLTEDEASAQGSLSGSWRYLFRKLFKAKLLQQSTLASARAPIMDLLTDMMSDETQGSLYLTKPYKQALLDIFEVLTCPHCKEILTVPVTLDCGDSFCWSCAEKICSKNKEGQRCCCSKCGWESVTEDLLSRINQTLLDVAAVARGLSASFGNGWSTSEACSEGDSEVEDMMSECSVSSFCSIGSMLPPPTMASKEKLFIRMFLTMDGLESEDKLSQQPSGSSDCTENEQRPEEETFTLQSLSGSGMYSSGGLFKSKLPEQGALASSRAHIMDLLTQMISAGTQGSKSLSEIRQPISVKFLSSSNSIPDHPAADGKLREPEISSPHGINSVKHCSRGFSPHLDCRRHVGEAQGLPFGESKVVRLYRRPSTSFSLRFL